jgi:hypothetical protein
VQRFAGIPVGLTLQAVPAGATSTFSARVELDMWLSRLRWTVHTAGLVVMDVRIGTICLTTGQSQGASFALFGEDGMWRFPKLPARCGFLLTVAVHNLSGATIYPHAVAFWGTPLEKT